MMTSDCVAFVAAPYGFGPASKAIAISSHLPRAIRRVFFGDGPSLDLARASCEFSTCTSLDFDTPAQSVANILSPYGTLVFVNSTRFLTLSSKTGASVVFVDTLAWTRGTRPSQLPTLSAYFAQRFFDHDFAAELESARSFHATGAIVPRAFAEPRDQRRISKRPPIVHCGGLYSPAMRPGADEAFVTQICRMLNETGLPMRVMLPKHLHTQFMAQAAAGVSLIDCSPINAMWHIQDSPFALTTSGIEFTYESVLLGVPTLFLPPFNATQLLQLNYYRHLFEGCVPFLLDHGMRHSTSQSLDADTAVIQERGMTGAWTTQFDTLGQYLRTSVLGGFPDTLTALRRQQQRAISNVGMDGANTIALHIVSDIENGKGDRWSCPDTSK
jgi:hypothetical protein